MKVGICKENKKVESRVAATPDSVSRLVKMGLDVAIEKGAGVLSGFPDAAYETAGAAIVSSKEICAADFIFSINLPSPSVLNELKSGSMLVTLPGLCEDDGTLSSLAEKNVDVLALERIPRISRAQSIALGGGGGEHQLADVRLDGDVAKPHADRVEQCVSRRQAGEELAQNPARTELGETP